MKLRFFLPVTVLSSLLLISCGGGGGGNGSDGDLYNGSTSSASISVDNTDDLAVAAASGAKQAIIADVAGDISFRSESIDNADVLNDLNTKIQKLLSSNQIANRTDDYSGYFCTDSGTASISYPDSYTGGTGTVNFTFSFNSCTSSYYGISVEINGTVSGTYSEGADSYSFTMKYKNLTIAVTSDATTETTAINGSQACSGDLDPYNYDDVCETYFDFPGYDGRTYRVSDVDLYGDADTGYYIDATVYDPDHGYFEISATAVTFCDSGYPGTGSISVTDGTHTETIEFLGCGMGYTITYDGVTSDPIMW
jgi:hypothetical protein